MWLVEIRDVHALVQKTHTSPSSLEAKSVHDSSAPKAEYVLTGNSAHINKSSRKTGFIGMEITYYLVSEASRMKMAQPGMHAAVHFTVQTYHVTGLSVAQ